jgi:hypothetical protein
MFSHPFIGLFAISGYDRVEYFFMLQGVILHILPPSYQDAKTVYAISQIVDSLTQYAATAHHVYAVVKIIVFAHPNTVIIPS